MQDKDLWKAYRGVASENPFLRVVKEQRGIYRVPEPKILAGSNYADLGFELDESSRHVVAICAIDNLMKGASGSAVQCMNLMLGLEETLRPGIHGLTPNLGWKMKMSAKQATLVVKLGGTEGVDFCAICQDAAALLEQGQRWSWCTAARRRPTQLGESAGLPAALHHLAVRVTLHATPTARPWKSS